MLTFFEARKVQLGVSEEERKFLAAKNEKAHEVHHRSDEKKERKKEKRIKTTDFVSIRMIGFGIGLTIDWSKKDSTKFEKLTGAPDNSKCKIARTSCRHTSFMC